MECELVAVLKCEDPAILLCEGVASSLCDFVAPSMRIRINAGLPGPIDAVIVGRKSR